LESTPPTLPFRQGAAPVCPNRMADPISAPDGPDSSPHPRCPSDSRSLLPPNRTTRRSSQPHHVPPRTEAKPIKDPPHSRGLAHCAVYSIPRQSAFAPYPGFHRPRNRANLFQSQSQRLNYPNVFNHFQTKGPEFPIPLCYTGFVGSKCAITFTTLIGVARRELLHSPLAVISSFAR
jgi:hypothetical protein